MIATELYQAGKPSNGHVERHRCAFGLPSGFSAGHRHAQPWTGSAGHEGLAHDDNFIHRSDPPTSC